MANAHVPECVNHALMGQNAVGNGKLVAQVGEFVGHGLGPVYIHRVQRTMATRLIIAAKHVSVFSSRVAMRRNALILQKKFSTRWRHLYFSESCAGYPEVPLRIGITASMPWPAKYFRNRFASNALSPMKARQAMPAIRTSKLVTS